jgi:CubicO group peptidase (beta-lactamase class C family)
VTSLLGVLIGCGRSAPTPVDDPATADTAADAQWGPPAVVGLPDGEGDGLVRTIREALGRMTGSAVQVVIVRSGEVVLSDAWGPADPEGGGPAGVDTVFEIGSETKKITAIAVLQAVDRGDLALDDTVHDVLPDLELAEDPGWDDACTVRDLLTHQSGLYDLTPWTHDPDDGALAGRVFGEFAAREYTMAPPGLFYNYANPNYAVLGLMVERVTGRAWADVVADDVFTPLGMSSTYARAADVPAGQRAVGVGYRVTAPGDWFDPSVPAAFEEGRVDPADHVDNAFIRPAGSVWSTAWDQARLLEFILHGGHPEVLSDASRALITSPAVKRAAPMSDAWTAWYGMGMVVRTDFLINFAEEEAKRDAPIWYHGGNTLDFTALGAVLPEQDLIVVVLGNGYGDDHWPIVEKAQLALVDLPDPEPIPWPPAPTDLTPFVGSWADPHGIADLTVTTDGTTLGVMAPELDAMGVGYTLTATFDGVAIWTIDGAPFEMFWLPGPDGDGQFVANRQFVGHRTDGVGDPPAPARALFPPPYTAPEDRAWRALAERRAEH